MSCAISPSEHPVDVPPAWLLRQPFANVPVNLTYDCSPCKPDFELSNVPRGLCGSYPLSGFPAQFEVKLGFGSSDVTQAPCEAESDIGLSECHTPFKATPSVDDLVGQEVDVLRTNGSWSLGKVVEIQLDIVKVALEDGGEKRIPMHLVHAQIKPKPRSARHAPPPRPATSERWSMRLPVSVLRSNGSWSQGTIIDLKPDFITVGLIDGGEKKIPAHLMDAQAVPLELAERSENSTGLSVGNTVTWTDSDNDIPAGTMGVVRGFKDAFVTVQFPNGTWDLLPLGLLKI